MVSKGMVTMVSKSEYWISEKNKGIPVSIFTVSTHIFSVMLYKGMVSKSKYWISENNKGDKYSKTPKKLKF